MGYQPLPVGYAPWNTHFAWWPVAVHGKYVWLKTVYRKRSKIRMLPDRIYTCWIYGTLFDVLSEPAPITLADVRGPQGLVGIQGFQGVAGPVGVQGEQGQYGV